MSRRETQVFEDLEQQPSSAFQLTDPISEEEHYSNSTGEI